jgi:hypothetical protein
MGEEGRGRGRGSGIGNIGWKGDGEVFSPLLLSPPSIKKPLTRKEPGALNQGASTTSLFPFRTDASGMICQVIENLKFLRDATF